MSFSHGFLLFLFCSCSFCPFLLLLPWGMGGVRTTHPHVSSAKRSLCVLMVIRETECSAGLMLLKFRGLLTFKCFGPHRTAAENNLPAYCSNVCKGIATPIMGHYPASNCRNLIPSRDVIPAVDAGGTGFTASFACCFGFLVVGVKLFVHPESNHQWPLHGSRPLF